MPEQLTKHPEVTLQVLRSGGAVCAQGAPLFVGPALLVGLVLGAAVVAVLVRRSTARGSR